MALSSNPDDVGEFIDIIDDDGVENRIIEMGPNPCMDCHQHKQQQQDVGERNLRYSNSRPVEKQFRMMEFFSGIGGMRLAVEGALHRHNNYCPLGRDEFVDIPVDGVHDGTEPSCRRHHHHHRVCLTYCQAYDISLYANRCYKYNFQGNGRVERHKDGNVTEDVVCTKLVEQLKQSDVDGKADLWTMSPPCQPFTTNKRGSNATQKNGGGDNRNDNHQSDNHTTPHVRLDSADKRCNGLKGLIRLLTTMEDKPQYIFLENVKGFGASEMVREWFDCLQHNGYCWKTYLLSPIQFGIPNHRQRFYVLCERSANRWTNSIHQEPCTSLPPTFETLQNGRPPLTVSHFIDPSLTHQRIIEDCSNGDDGALSNVDNYLVPDSVLERDWAKGLGTVTGLDTATHCFTAGYGRIYHRSTGSLLLMEPVLPPRSSLASSDKRRQDDVEVSAVTAALSQEPLNRENMIQYSGRLRKFTPEELLKLFGFPEMYAFPNDIPLEHRYKLIGNSINVAVVTELLYELLFGGRHQQIQQHSGNAASDNEHVDDDSRWQKSDSLETMVVTKMETTCSAVNQVAGSTASRREIVGGTKGHVMEEIVDSSLLALYRHYRWKMIPNCTGRYTCRDHHKVSTLSPLQLLEDARIVASHSAIAAGGGHKVYTFHLPDRPDRVMVVPLDTQKTVGLITFEKELPMVVEGEKEKTPRSYVHTLNTASGFRRKLTAIGIQVVADDIICSPLQL